MAASFKPQPGGVYLRPAGSNGPFDLSLNGILPINRAEHPRITVDDLNVTFAAKCTTSPESLNALRRMCCEAGLERLSEIDGLLAR